ncbi:major facilitator superfamily domain-containing protein [Zychaea mexicana]|uniref:major facilitator superfamily domain-containing protein n=1 Tax=Zychaea mexicana TaxID=64656 RepID=UPI0022FEDF17|nr:major facilitator superfamily domain-containing protein [Zychaea mexicana]KAI9496815.1 major facilitator superfamily domain-containing protein [Zychaea mexicana]
MHMTLIQTEAMAGPWLSVRFSAISLRSEQRQHGVRVFQAYFEKDVFHDVPDAQFQLSFAGTLIGIMVNIAGPFFQILSARFDIRLIIALGVIVMVLGLELAAFTTQIWHLYLTQGVMFGIGAAFLYVTAVSVPPQWFNRRRGLGLGIVTSGSGVGGVVLPFIISSLTNRVGIAWAYRILGFIYLGMNAITCILVKEKYPRHKKVKAADDGEEQPAVTPPKLNEIFDFSILKDKIFLWWVIASVVATMGCFTPFFFLPSYASYHGLSSDDGTAFSAVLAGSNCLGRISAGYIGDRIGRLNTLILASFLSAIAAFGIWTVATDYNTIMAFAVVYGAFSTAYYTLVSPITATIVGIEKFPTALSVMMLSNTISIVGPNIASAIENALDAEPYFSYKMYTGACFIVGALLLLSLKIKMTHGVFTKI